MWPYQFKKLSKASLMLVTLVFFLLMALINALEFNGDLEESQFKETRQRGGANRPNLDFCVKKSDGRFADFANCHLFYKCFNRRTIVQWCPPNLVFNPFSMDCDLTYNVPHCQASNGTHSSIRRKVFNDPTITITATTTQHTTITTTTTQPTTTTTKIQPTTKTTITQPTTTTTTATTTSTSSPHTATTATTLQTALWSKTLPIVFTSTTEHVPITFVTTSPNVRVVSSKISSIACSNLSPTHVWLLLTIVAICLVIQR